MNFNFKRMAAWILIVFISVPMSSVQAAQTVITQNEVEVTAPREPQRQDKNFLPDVQGTKIYSGKKTSLIQLADAPKINNNNFRQAMAKIPGLLLSEEATPLFSVGYRGLDPHRAQFVQVMKDGVPIHADMFGYPEAYYVPPLDSVDAIEFVRGGAGLMFGPQPGGALNFVTHQSATDTKARLSSSNSFGSHNLFSTYEALTGTVGPVGYYGFIHERQGDGFRTMNSDFEVLSSGVKLTLNQTGDSRLTAAFDQYAEQHGEPGGITRAQFDQDPELATRAHDLFRLERYYGNIRYEKELDEDTQLDLLVYGGHYRRWSKRQNGGGFGTIPTANTNSIEEQDFYNLGLEQRLKHSYEALGGENDFSIGTHTFMSHSPRVDMTGNSSQADSGAITAVTVRDTWYFSPFIENRFKWGNFSITPGVRLENIWQRLNEKIKTTRAPNKTKTYDFAPLFGVGMTYEIVKGIEAYANISQSYRPKVFTQAIPTGAAQIINDDLEEGKGVQYDFGFRGKRHPFWNWDIDYFLMSFTNQIGNSGNTVTNGGRTHYHGIEMFQEFDVMGAWDYLKDTQHAEKYGNLAPFFTATLLNAEYSAGPFEGRQPQYAPKYNARVGVNYRWRDRAKISFLGTFLGDHNASDNTASNFNIPSYKVWDLTAEVDLLKNVKDVFDLSLFGGINNIFDEKYFARVRSDGIDPADGRNLYGGVKINLG